MTNISNSCRLRINISSILRRKSGCTVPHSKHHIHNEFGCHFGCHLHLRLITSQAWFVLPDTVIWLWAESASDLCIDPPIQTFIIIIPDESSFRLWSAPRVNSVNITQLFESAVSHKRLVCACSLSAETLVLLTHRVPFLKTYTTLMSRWR